VKWLRLASSCEIVWTMLVRRLNLQSSVKDELSQPRYLGVYVRFASSQRHEPGFFCGQNQNQNGDKSPEFIPHEFQALRSWGRRRRQGCQHLKCLQNVPRSHDLERTTGPLLSYRVTEGCKCGHPHGHYCGILWVCNGGGCTSDMFVSDHHLRHSEMPFLCLGTLFVGGIG